MHTETETIQVPVQPWEDWAKAKKTHAVHLSAARHHARWPVGREVTEAVFDSAVSEALSSRIG